MTGGQDARKEPSFPGEERECGAENTKGSTLRSREKTWEVVDNQGDILGEVASGGPAINTNLLAEHRTASQRENLV